MWSPLRDYNYSVHRLLGQAARRNLADFEGRVLDLGCGDSPYRDCLPPTARRVAVDRMRQSTAELLAAGEALPFADASFDAAMCTEMIAFARQPWRVMAELARVVRRGGRIYLTAPADWHALDDPPDYYRFTRAGVEALLEDAGFTVERLESVGGQFSALMGKVLEETLQRVWFAPWRRLGFGRGAYLAAALASLPWNGVTLGLAPLFDRLNPRNPFAIAGVGRRR